MGRGSWPSGEGTGHSGTSLRSWASRLAKGAKRREGQGSPDMEERMQSVSLPPRGGLCVLANCPREGVGGERSRGPSVRLFLLEERSPGGLALLPLDLEAGLRS